MKRRNLFKAIFTAPFAAFIPAKPEAPRFDIMRSSFTEYVGIVFGRADITVTPYEESAAEAMRRKRHE